MPTGENTSPALTPAGNADESVERSPEPRAGHAPPLPPPPQPWWTTSAPFIAVIVSAVLPITTLVHGCVDKETKRMESEHAIVDKHLQSALSEPTDSETHVRRLRFLRELDIGGNSVLTANLRAWAEHEYKLYFDSLSSQATTVALEYNELNARAVGARRKIEEDEEWWLKAESTWTWGDSERRDDIRRDAEDRVRNDILSKRRADAEVMEEKRDAALELWRSIEGRFRFDEDKSNPAKIYEDPAAFLAVGCEGGVSRDCIDLAELERSRNQFELAVTHYTRACSELHSPLGCTYLARSLRKGEGVTKDETKAADLFELACDPGGEPQACNGLGWRFYSAEGRQQDKKRARELFEFSCSVGWMNGCDSLATWYSDEQSYAKAEEWWSLACRRGEVRACVNHANHLLGLAPDEFKK